MKYIKTNEELKFMDAIKNKIKGLFDNIDQKIADKISGKAAEMAKQTNKDAKAKIYNDMVSSILGDAKLDIENSKNIIELRKAFKGTLSNLYATLTSLANSAGYKSLLPSQIFSKKFTFMGKIDPKNFDSSIDVSVNKYLLNLKISDEDKKLVTDNKSIDVEVSDVKESEDMEDIKTTITDYIESIITFCTTNGDVVIKSDALSQTNKSMVQFTNQMGSKNPKSEEKLLRYVTNIKDPKQLASVRDVLVQKGVIPKDDANNMKF